MAYSTKPFVGYGQKPVKVPKPKREMSPDLLKYATERFSGKSPMDAFVAVKGRGDGMTNATLHNRAAVYERNKNVQSKLAELREMAQLRAKFTVDDMVLQLDEDRAFARKNGSPAAAITASMGKAKLLGLMVDKVESKNDVTIDVVSKSQRDAAVQAALMADK